MSNLYNRELSWLSFNERVLQESLDIHNPIIERLRFLGIYSNNLDEFFRVRVANLNRMLTINNNKIEGFNGTTKILLEKVHHTIKQQRKIYDISYQRLLTELEEHNIFHVNEKTVPEKFKPALQDYFNNELKQDIIPLILDKKRGIPRLLDKEIYLAIKILNPKKNRFALIQVPNSHKRFHVLQDQNKTYIIILDDIIRLFLEQVFAIFEFQSIKAFTFKFTRDAELNIDDDISISMYDKMEESIKQRKKGEALRFVYDNNMDKDLLKFIQSNLGINALDHIAPGGRYHNFKDLMSFPDFNESNFSYPKYLPKTHEKFSKKTSLLKTIIEEDVLLHFPFHKFDHIIDILREAAIDPKVKEIKITIYRISKDSQIINALINAIKNGKEVTVIAELQARFDEENNMYWSSILREHGAKIIYGIPGLKVHAKLILISRVSGKKETQIAHIGTGNFHEKNARTYTDFSLLTANQLITKEVTKVFNLLENNIERTTYRNLLISPFNNRRKLIYFINQEIKNAKKGKIAFIKLKLNNLVDNKLIQKLYEASEVGVQVQLIIRGICCMLPLNENIKIKSIVGRFLEHSRLLIFCNNEEPLVYISSADWMTRNLDKRIEVSTPILDENVKSELLTIFDYYWMDSEKSRIIDKYQKNKMISSEDNKFDVQSYLINNSKTNP